MNPNRLEELEKLACESLRIIQDLQGQATSGFETYREEWSTYFQILHSQCDTLDSILRLLNDGKYKECFILLRTVFETYLVFLLMLKGRRYRETKRFNIIPDPSSNKKDARDRTMEKWVKEWKCGDAKYKNIVAIDPAHDDEGIYVTYELEGLFEEKDIEMKGQLVTMYYFAFHEYNPNVHYLASLPSISAGDLFPEISKERQREQKRLYHTYFYIDSVLRNLQINKLITDEQKDRIIVHYNFLSSFTHTTLKGLRAVKIGGWNYVDFSEKRFDPILSELLLLYVVSLLQMYLSAILTFFKERKTGDWYIKYETMVNQLNEANKDFWFIFNQPTEFDVKVSDEKKGWLKVEKRLVDEDVVLYYDDPIDRLSRIRLKHPL